MERLMNQAWAERIRPTTIEELQRVVAAAAAAGRAVLPVGGGLSIIAPPPQDRPADIVDMTALCRIVDYPVEDMTITVEAGIRMAELNAVLAGNGQMLPFDVAVPEQATLGGVLATRWCGPRRYGYGTPRDYVLGIDVVDAKARRIVGGGRVVKNVAGYDLMKMHVGARGTLGIIAQATLRLRPLPDAQAALECAVDWADIERLLERLNRTATRPVGIELLVACDDDSPSARVGTRCKLTVLYEECREAVDWQMDTAIRELQEVGVTDACRIDGAAYETRLRSLCEWPEASRHLPLLQIAVAPSAVEHCLRAVHGEWRAESSTRAGNGIAFIRPLTAEPRDWLAGAERLRRAWSHTAARFVRWPAAAQWPASTRRALDSLSPQMKALKLALDGGNIMNPTAFDEPTG